jgi:Outer membrane protein beta-barrel domain
MLNLSDKDLDRLSREAAGEYDPGDIVGPRSWEKLEMGLDRHLGHVIPRHVRRFYRLPFYYAPVVLLLVGASYYFIRNHKTQKEVSSGSPPLTLVKPAPTSTDKPSTSSQNPVSTDKSTSTLALPPATTEQPSASAAGAGSRRNLTSGSSATSPVSAAPATSAASTGNSASTGSTTSPRSLTASSSSAGAHSPLTHRRSINGHDRSMTSFAGSPISAAGKSAGKSNVSDASIAVGPDNASPNSSTKGSTELPSGTAKGSGTAPPSGTAGRSLSLSTVRGPVPTKHSGRISDSALRAFTAKSMPSPIQRKGGASVNRSLQIGVLLAPDFSSVNSMSGDKPGSSIGLTADYQFAHRWYVGTGLLLSRKNYAAAPQDYHAPKDYYSTNGMNNMNFIKGSLNMLEIPLNLRYDFSVTGNTLFFASAGLSSYLLNSENCNYYYQPWNLSRQASKNVHYNNEPDYLFSALDLSVGVEMGINNSLSVLVAPYVKVPVRNIGFGQVELSSVGINFIFEFTPVLSRKR